MNEQLPQGKKLIEVKILNYSSRTSARIGALLLIVALVFGYFVGREHVKYQIRKAVESAFSSLSDGLNKASGELAGEGQGKAVTRGDATKAKVEAYLPYLKLSELAAAYEEDPLDGRVAVVRGKLKNTGTKTLTEVEITAYFMDKSGQRIYEETYLPVSVDAISFEGDTEKPLKPGYIREFGFKAENCPKEWNSGTVECAITAIKFED
jgi:hypothetical protein